MKCENCGKNEANYHYRSNINGKVTERHLCSECAGKLGYEENVFAGVGSMFENMFSDFFGRTERYLSSFSPWPGMRLTMPALFMPSIEIQAENEQPAEKAPADPELKKAREINALRGQMAEAVEKEEFEKAAEIRDKIRELEKSEDSGEKGE
jgi:protein arginine kinase activator